MMQPKRKRVEEWAPSKLNTEQMSKKLQSLSISSDLPIYPCNTIAQANFWNNSSNCIIKPKITPRQPIIDEIEIEDCYVMPMDKIIISNPNVLPPLTLYREPFIKQNDKQLVVYTPRTNILNQTIPKVQEPKEDAMELAE
jgi:hypothetical protein